MDERIKQIYNACEPNLPATPQYYSDCRKARGGDALTGQIIKRLKMSSSAQHLRFLFTGHIGSGKSSELLHLVTKLDETVFFPIYIDFKDYLDEEDTKLEDIFLAMAIEIGYALRDKMEANASMVKWSQEKLTNSSFGKLFSKAKNYIVSEAEVDDVEIGLPFDIAKVKLKRLKQNPTARQIIHEAIRTERTSLLAELNILILQAELFLKQNTSFTNLILIADGLEKIEKFDGQQRGLESHRQLFIESQTQLTGIDAHIVYTIPLSLYRSYNDAPKLALYYGKDSFVLPMVKIHQRGNFAESYPGGREALKIVLGKRLRQIPLAEAFNADALEHLIIYSGGSIRNLLRFVQEAVVAVDSLPVDFAAARESVGGSVRAFAASVKESRWAKLAALELSPHQQIENGDEDYSFLLENTTVLEYRNGRDEYQTDGEDNVWYAVNPVIRRTLKFQDAVAKAKTEAATRTQT